MSTKKRPLLEKVFWSDVRNNVVKVNPELANRVDALGPGKDYPLIKVRYNFGQKILHNGELHLPYNGAGLLKANHPSIPADIQELLSYRTSLPAGIVLSKVGELYVDIDSYINPWRVFYPGKIFGLWNILQEKDTVSYIGKIFQLTAGARSMFMAPKISDAVGYKHLHREFNIQSPMPQRSIDQWNLFVELSNHESFADEWQMELLFFSERWLMKLNDPAWNSFRSFLYKIVWLDNSYLRDQITFNSVFSFALKDRNLKPNPYLADTVKHLYLAGRGSHPSFVIAHDDSAGPISTLQNIFIHTYNLKYLPTMLHTWIYAAEKSKKKPCYYFLSFPTLVEFFPRTKELKSKFEDLREIKHIMNGLIDYIKEDEWGLKGTSIYHWAENIHYDYFHTERDKYGENIRHTSEIAQSDASLMKEAVTYRHKSFCDSSAFFRGCIQIMPKKSAKK